MFDTKKNESMNNLIAYIAPKNKTMAHSMSLNNIISCVVGISILGFKTYWKKSVRFDRDTKKFKNSNSSCKQKHSTPRRTSHNINDTMSSDWEPSTSRQWSNNKYTITCLQGEVGWTIFKGYSLKQVSSTWKSHNNSQWKMNREKSTEAVPVWLHQALTIYFKGLPCGTCN